MHPKYKRMTAGRLDRRRLAIVHCEILSSTRVLEDDDHPHPTNVASAGSGHSTLAAYPLECLCASPLPSTVLPTLGGLATNPCPVNCRIRFSIKSTKNVRIGGDWKGNTHPAASMLLHF